MQTLIGNISLNISFVIYFIWFVPQLFLNFKRKDTEGLSMLMHGVLCIGYLCDLMYGFGRHMQWQYRAVTIIGLISLSIQHYQIGRYGLHRYTEKLTYIVLSVIFGLLIGFCVYALHFSQFQKQIFNAIGMITNICWLSYVMPQILKNYHNKSTSGLSLGFVSLSIFLNLCDTTSAWMLGWDYPSKIGPSLSLVQNIILMLQIRYYAQRQQKFSKLAIDS